MKRTAIVCMAAALAAGCAAEPTEVVQQQGAVTTCSSPPQSSQRLDATYACEWKAPGANIDWHSTTVVTFHPSTGYYDVAMGCPAELQPSCQYPWGGAWTGAGSMQENGGMLEIVMPVWQWWFDGGWYPATGQSNAYLSFTGSAYWDHEAQNSTLVCTWSSGTWPQTKFTGAQFPCTSAIAPGLAGSTWGVSVSGTTSGTVTGTATFSNQSGPYAIGTLSMNGGPAQPLYLTNRLSGFFNFGDITTTSPIDPNYAAPSWMWLLMGTGSATGTSYSTNARIQDGSVTLTRQ